MPLAGADDDVVVCGGHPVDHVAGDKPVDLAVLVQHDVSVEVGGRQHGVDQGHEYGGRDRLQICPPEVEEARQLNNRG